MALVIAFPDLKVATERRGDGDDGSDGRVAEMELCELMMLPKMVVTKRGAVSHKDPASVGCSPQRKVTLKQMPLTHSSDGLRTEARERKERSRKEHKI